MATEKIEVTDRENGDGEIWRIYDATVEDGEVTHFIGQRMIMPVPSFSVFNFWSTVMIQFNSDATDEQILDGMRKIDAVTRDLPLA